MYQKILDKKLNTKATNDENKDKGLLNGKQLITKKMQEIRAEMD